MAYPANYIAMVVGAVRTLVGVDNMHLRDAIARVARQMSLDPALVDSWVKQSPEYTAREDAPGAARRGGTSANKRSAEHEQGVKAREKANASPFPRAAVKRAYGVSDRGAKVTGVRPHDPPGWATRRPLSRGSITRAATFTASRFYPRPSPSRALDAAP